MKRRICVIGNSHITAVRLGWRIVEDEYPEFELHFIAAPGSSMSHLVVKDGALQGSARRLPKYLLILPERPERRLPLDEFDEFWTVGLGFGLPRVLEVYKMCCAESMEPSDRRALVSDALFAELSAAALRTSLAYTIVQAIRAAIDRKSLFIAMQGPSARLPVDTASDHEDAGKRADDVTLGRMYRTATSLIEREGMSVRHQPAETLDGPILTHARFREKTPPRTNGEEQAKEYNRTHANSDFGVILLREIFRERYGVEPALPGPA